MGSEIIAATLPGVLKSIVSFNKSEYFLPASSGVNGPLNKSGKTAASTPAVLGMLWL